MSIWKILGLAGLASFAGATGAVVVRRRREWGDVEPDELQRQLHARLERARSEGRV